MVNDYQQNLKEETEYLEKTLSFVKKALDSESGILPDKKRKLIALRKDMWENTAPVASDIGDLTEITQYLSQVNYQTAEYDNFLKQIEKYKIIMGSPYFGRFDFKEDGSNQEEKIYIGLYNIMDPKTHNIFVYDWRAPISSIFYQHEPGGVSYKAPIGTITGNMPLKRQHKIQDSRLKYFFDCSITINDEILQEVLSRNSSPRMRNIVGTIQREQDIIIRDTENELLIVQGVAGSGKTSIALHRIAFLLYNGMRSNVNSNNFLIVSPNDVFNQYISSILPELGEENVGQTTFDDIIARHFEGKLKSETRYEQIESLITSQNCEEMAARLESIEFKGSRTFLRVLNRLIAHYQRRMIAFEDVYYNGGLIETRQRIKNIFLNNKAGRPMAMQLKRVENMILDKVHPLQKMRHKKIEKIVENSEGHELEVRAFSRLLSIKETRVFMGRLREFTEVDYARIYKTLFNEPGLFFKLARGLQLPEDIEQMILKTKESLEKGCVQHEDCAPLLFLMLRVEGSNMFSDIKHVVIDEAQDYYPLQYEVFNLLFKHARYTVLGDINQAIEKDADISLYEDIQNILDKTNTVKLNLNKSYRSSYEINAFTQKLLVGKRDFISFERHEDQPVVIYKDNQYLIDQAMARDIDYYLDLGYESIAVICKTLKEAGEIYARLKNFIDVKLVNTWGGELKKGVLVIPCYAAKGLEFDVVLVHGVSKENYYSELDRKLLYIACTRALHSLSLYYTGEKSPFV